MAAAKTLGYEKVYSLGGGLAAWKSAGLHPVLVGDDARNHRHLVARHVLHPASSLCW